MFRQALLCVIACTAVAALLTGCGGGGQANAEPLRAACRDGRSALAQVGPITRLRDVPPSLRRVVAVERQAREAVAKDDPLARRLSAAIAATRRVLTLVEQTDPLLLQTMSPLRTAVPDVRRSVATARELVGEVCRRAGREAMPS
jgi:hypothetical protein